MLNEALFDSNKDLKIAKLTNEIRSFKKYDEERKEYYRKALIRLGEAEEMLDSIEAKNPLYAVKNLMKAKNAKIHELKNKFSVELNAQDAEIRSLKLEIEELKAKIGGE